MSAEVLLANAADLAITELAAANSPDDSAAEAPADDATSSEAGSSADHVARDQAQLANRFKRLEETFLRLAELSGASDPGQAELLRKAMVESKQRLIAVQLEQIVERLENDRLGDALAAQQRVREDLKALLELLLSDVRADRLEQQQQRTAEWLKQIDDLIHRQQSLRGRTERADNASQLAEDQGELADETDALRQSMADPASGEPSDRANGDQKGGAPKNADARGGENKPVGRDDASDLTDDDTSPRNDKPGADAESQNAEPGESAEGGNQREGEPSPAGEPGQTGDAAEKNGGEETNPAGEGESAESSGADESGETSESGESESGAGESGGDGAQGEQSPSEQRLAEARRRMRQARERLEQAERKSAVEEQNEALRQLEQAKAELEEVLRQLREEEIAQMLTMLEAHFRRMLQEQAEIYEETALLDEKQTQRPSPGDRVQATRLSEREAQLAANALTVLRTLRDDGSTTALPEAVEHVHRDMKQVVGLIADYDTGSYTQAVEQDIITGLEELLEAVKQAQDEQDQRQQQAQSQNGGQAAEPTLVDKLAELRMIRSLQLRINRRTRQIDARAAEPNTPAESVDEALQQLAEQEESVIRATQAITEGADQ
ncbi:MAG: hypothetical protein KDA63_07775 [Planctomycetales bacterium]|nr:hypothetical protein [Planctomycetales bacterium]